jgi:hypothetical protein
VQTANSFEEMRNAEYGVRHGDQRRFREPERWLRGRVTTDLLWSRFHDHIEGRFRGTADPRRSALRENVLIL